MAKLGFVIIGLTFWALLAIGIINDNRGLMAAAIVVGVISIGAAFVMNMKPATTAMNTRQRIWNEGTPATATVISSRTVGTLNDDPRVELRLEVTVPGQAPKTIETTQVISRSSMPRVQVGSEIDVKVDPKMPAVVVVDEALTPNGYS